jgi:hypothetical protein
MRAYKFLDERGRSPFVGAEWVPGRWVESPVVTVCDSGVHACRLDDLSYWLHDALWEIELDGEVVPSRHKVAAPRGRLVQRVDGYRDAVRELATIGTWRARDLAVVALRAAGDDHVAGRYDACGDLESLAALAEDALTAAPESTFAGTAAALASDAAYFALHGNAAQSPFVACCAAGHAAAGPQGDQTAYDAGYAAERAFQSRWLADRLALAPTA